MARLTAEEKALRAITEREWQSQVQRLASSLGWKFYHAPDNKPVNGRIQKVVAGFPDLVLVKAERLIFAELKREQGIVADAQMEWLEALKLTGAECYIWRPSNMREVRDTLSKKP